MSGQDKKSADAWINTASFLKFFSIFSNAYWLASFFNLAIQKDQDEDAIGLSRYAIAFGLIIGFFAVVGFTWSHRALYQNTATATDEAPEEHEDNTQEEQSLSLKQIGLLAGNHVTCATDAAGPLGLVVKIATAELSPSKTFFLTSNSAFLIFGLFCAYAETRACKNAMKNTGNPGKDKWTILGAIGEFSGIFSDAYFFSRLLHLLLNKNEDFLGVSYVSFALGSLIALLTSIGETYTHWKVNTHRVPDESQSTTEVKLSPAMWLALIGNFIAQTAEFAAVTAFALELADHKNPFNRIQKIAINAGLFGIGAFGADADTRKGYEVIVASSQTESEPDRIDIISNNDSTSQTSLLPPLAAAAT